MKGRFEVSYSESDVEKEIPGLSGKTIARIKQPVTESVQARAEELEHLGFKALDALPIACAEAGGTDVLPTTDDRMLAKAKKLRGNLRVGIENPILWLMEVTPK